MLVVPVWVTHIVLHVANESICPIRHINRTIATDFNICRSEIWIGRYQNRFDFRRCNIGPVIANFMLQYAEESDAVTDKEIALVGIREVAA